MSVQIAIDGGQISESLRVSHPGIPWRQIIAQRNVLSHEYDEIGDARIWRLAIEAIPRLVAQLTPLVPPPPKETDTR